MKIYTNVSQTQLSIARYYGGAKIDGKEYKYDYANDALIFIDDMNEYEKEVAKIEGAKSPKWNPDFIINP